MKKIKQLKKGISLIVLVITIIVMIIIAATIILSLSGNGIIGKASKARTDSDIANKKQAASVALGEYKLEKRFEEMTMTPTQYVQDKLKKQGIDGSDVAVTQEGEILVGLTKVAVQFVEAGVKIGDVVTGYELETGKTKYNTSAGYSNGLYENTAPENTELDVEDIVGQDVIRDEAITWKYFGIDEKGEAIIVGSVNTNASKMTLSGKGGYLYGTNVLDNTCEYLYSSNMGKARNIKIEDVTRLLEYTGPRCQYRESTKAETTYSMTTKTIGKLIEEGERPLDNTITPDGRDINEYTIDYFSIYREYDTDYYNEKRAELIFPELGLNDLTSTYWLSSTNVYVWFYKSPSRADFQIGLVTKTAVGAGYTCTSTGGTWLLGTYAMRPIVKLASDVKLTSYNGNIATIDL